MRHAVLILTILIVIYSCSKNEEIRTKKDIFFGLELGMKQKEVDDLLNSIIKRDTSSYYVSHFQITHFRGSEDRKIEINFYQPFFKDSILTKYSYTLQVITRDEEYLTEVHKQILDELKYQHGNAKAVNFKDKETILNWNLGANETLELRIDKEDNLYGLSYELKYDIN
jgi:hypothetical protein